MMESETDGSIKSLSDLMDMAQADEERLQTLQALDGRERHVSKREAQLKIDEEKCAEVSKALVEREARVQRDAEACANRSNAFDAREDRLQKAEDGHAKTIKAYETTKTISTPDREILQKEKQQLEMEKTSFEAQAAASMVNQNKSDLDRRFVENAKKTHRVMRGSIQVKNESSGSKVGSAVHHLMGCLPRD